MEVSRFEAAVLCYYRETGRRFCGNSLVIDLSSCSVGLCRCSAGGKTELVFSRSAPKEHDVWEGLLRRVAGSMPSLPYTDVDREMTAQLSTLNERVGYYFYSGKTLDQQALQIADNTISCSELEELAAEEKNLLLALLEQVRGEVPEGMDDGELKIILTGRAAALHLFAWYIRETLSADPLLPDERFVNDPLQQNQPLQVAPEQIILLGRQYFADQSTMKHDYSLRVYDGKVWTLIPLARKGQEKAKLERPQFVGPFFGVQEDVVSIEVDGALKKLTIPPSFIPAEGALFDMAIGVNDNQPRLVLRQCSHPQTLQYVNVT